MVHIARLPKAHFFQKRNPRAVVGYGVRVQVAAAATYKDIV